MKKLIAAVLTASAVLATPALYAQAAPPDTLAITESNEGLALTATYNGAPLAVTLTPQPAVQDHWTIQFPLGYIFSPNTPSLFVLGEPENPAQYNQVSITQRGTIDTPAFMTWDSDLPNTTGVTPVNPITVAGAGTHAGNTFNLVLADTITSRVPDAVSTSALLGLALGAIGIFRSRLSRANRA